MKLNRASLWSLEEYAERRDDFRHEVMAYKKNRRIALGEHATLLFEDEKTIKYQIQEMLRAEKIFDSAGINEELDAYNPLIPDGENWKATMLIEYPDEVERATALGRMPGVEHKVWAKIGDNEPVYAIANEDLERSTDEKTAAVHFLRFELGTGNCAALKAGAQLSLGVESEVLPYSVVVDKTSVASLVADLD